MPGGKDGLNDEGEDCEMDSISRKVGDFTKKYDSSAEKSHRTMLDQIDSHLFMSEFAKMRSHSKKFPTDAKKLFKRNGTLDKIANLFLATAN